MHPRLTIVLCFLAAVFVMAAVYIERVRPTDEVAAQEQAAPLLGPHELPEEVITRITLERDDAQPLMFERGLLGQTTGNAGPNSSAPAGQTSGGWQQVEPFAYPMDAYSITQLIRITQQLQTVKEIRPDQMTQGLTPKDLGLEPPQARITFDWSGGSLAIDIGRRGIGGRSYVRIVGRESIYVVNYDLHDRAVVMDPKDWRDRKIFQNVGVDSDRIELVAGADITILVRDRKTWLMEAPAKTRLNTLARDELLQKLGRAQSAGFILDQPEDLSRFGLTDPAGSIAVTTTRLIPQRSGEVLRVPETQRLIIGSRMGVGSQDRFGMVEGRPAVVRVPGAALQAIFVPPGQLISPIASGADRADVRSIRISGPAGEFTIERDLERWVAPEQGRREIPAARVDRLLDALTSLRATGMELAPFPRELSVATIALFTHGGRPLDAVLIAREAAPSAPESSVDATAPETQSEASEPTGRWIIDNGDGVLRSYPASLQLPLRPSDFGLLTE